MEHDTSGEGGRDDHFRGLVERYERAVSSFFARRGFSSEERRDLTQETFFRVYKGIGEVREEQAVQKWLFTVAANIYRNELRRRGADKREATVLSLDEARDQGRQFPAGSVVGGSSRRVPLDDVLAQETQRLLSEALAELPPRMRRCVMLRLARGMKYREIAVILQVSVETVKVQLHQARKRLKERLGDHFTGYDF